MASGPNYEAFEAYDFKSDQKFCAGWENIRKTLKDEDPPQLAAMKLLEAKVFYYSKFFEPINLNDYNDWVSQKDTEENTSNKENNGKESNSEDSKLSFNEVIRMVENGETLPGVKELNIEPTNNDITQSTVDPVKKPWEN